MKNLVNDLYKTTASPSNFKKEVYNMLEGLKTTRNDFLSQIEGEIEAARRDPYRVNDRPVEFGNEKGVNYNPNLLEAIGKFLPNGESTDVSQNLEKVFKQITRFETIFISAHSIYIGEVNAEGEKEGMGVIINNLTSQSKEADTDALDDSIIEQGIKEGFVESKHSSETTIYFGGFKHNEFDGMGTHIDSKGNRYEGMFSRGLKEGHGKMIYADDTIYDGYWHNGDKHGFGFIEFSKGINTLNSDQKNDEDLLK
jgi:hypothetical protein